MVGSVRRVRCQALPSLRAFALHDFGQSLEETTGSRLFRPALRSERGPAPQGAFVFAVLDTRPNYFDPGLLCRAQLLLPDSVEGCGRGRTVLFGEDTLTLREPDGPHRGAGAGAPK